jgi:hypothetical protein
VFKVVLMSRRAWQQMRRENIPVEMVLRTYDDPDSTRASMHDDLREIRTRWFGEEGVEVVVDTLDGRVVTVWRRGWKP